MTRLEEALCTLGLEGEISLAGRWAKLRGERGTVYVIEASWGRGYYTWCDAPRERGVELHSDPVAAIRAGLRRAASPETRSGGDDAPP